MFICGILVIETITKELYYDKYYYNQNKCF